MFKKKDFQPIEWKEGIFSCFSPAPFLPSPIEEY